MVHKVHLEWEMLSNLKTQKPSFPGNSVQFLNFDEIFYKI